MLHLLWTWIKHYMVPTFQWQARGHIYDATCPWCVYDDTDPE